MRLVAVSALFAARIARADVAVEVVGGVGVPVADDTWTGLAHPSPKVGARVGLTRGEWGMMISVDWTRERTNEGDGGLGLPEGTASLDTVRVLAKAVMRHRAAPSITLSASIGAGADLAIGKVDYLQDFGGGAISGHDFGLAIEASLGLWFEVASGTEVGVELATPVGVHRDRPYYQVMYLTFDYTSVDVDLLVGVRF